MTPRATFFTKVTAVTRIFFLTSRNRTHAQVESTLNRRRVGFLAWRNCDGSALTCANAFGREIVCTVQPDSPLFCHPKPLSVTLMAAHHRRHPLTRHRSAKGCLGFSSQCGHCPPTTRQGQAPCGAREAHAEACTRDTGQSRRIQCRVPAARSSLRGQTAPMPRARHAVAHASRDGAA